MSSSVEAFFKQHGVKISTEDNIFEAFSRLLSKQNWKPRTITKKRDQFNEIVFAADHLMVLQHLCGVFGLPEGQSKTQCRKHLRTIHVNICDVLEGIFRTFPSYKALRKDLAHRRISKNEAKNLNMAVFLVFL